MAKVMDENHNEIIIRLFIYSLCFVVVQMSLLSVVKDFDTPSGMSLFGYSMLELFIPMLWLPHFIVVALVARIKRPFWYSVAYIATFKFVYMTIPIFFLTMFVWSENYLFAFLKGTLVLLFLLVFVFLFPMLAGSGAKQRFFLVVVTAGLLVVGYYSGNVVFGFFPKSPVNTLRGSALVDPIGLEFDKVRKVFHDDKTKVDPYSRFKEMTELIGSFPRNDLELVEKADSLGAQIDGFMGKLAESDSLFVVERDSLNRISKILKYETPKLLCQKRMLEIESGRNLLAVLGSYLNGEENVPATEILERLEVYQDRRIQRMTSEIDNLKIRNKLRSWGILID